MRSILRLPLLIWVFLTLISYLSVLVSPGLFKYSGLIAFSIPILILLNLIITVLSAFFRWKVGWVTLILTLLAYPFYSAGVALRMPINEDKSELTVMNYNVKWFTDAKQNNYNEVIEWINTTDVDVMCFQEYYPLKGISSRIRKNGKYYESMDKETFHVAIYSKFPIVNDGLVFDDDRLNNIRFADLLINSDTIRIYSVHLQSMGINPEKIQDSEGIKSEYEDVTNRFISGSQGRTEQLKELIRHAEACSYPKVITGDFNDVPFSYNYFQLKSKFENAFENAGSGFGATYNGKIPYLRIDNQFYSAGLKANDLRTLNHIKFSDHFPLIGKYEITP